MNHKETTLQCNPNHCDRMNSQTSEYFSKFCDPLISSYKKKFFFPAPHNKDVPATELYERTNRLLPLAIKTDSTQRRDYQKRNPISVTGAGVKDSDFFNADVPYIDQTRPTFRIDGNNYGNEKYLDIYATRNTLDHRYFSADERKNDAITIWDWMGQTKVRGKAVKIDGNQHEVCNERGKFTTRNIMQFMPHRGLLSECQEHYSMK